MNKNFVFDSYAILALLNKEMGADKVKKLLQKAENDEVKIYFPVIALGEVFYILIREIGEEQAFGLITKIENLAIEIVDIDIVLTKEAAKIKAQGGLSYADSFVLALAISVDGIVATGDKEFKKFANLAKFLWL